MNIEPVRIKRRKGKGIEETIRPTQEEPCVPGMRERAACDPGAGDPDTLHCEVIQDYSLLCGLGLTQVITTPVHVHAQDEQSLLTRRHPLSMYVPWYQTSLSSPLRQPVFPPRAGPRRSLNVPTTWNEAESQNSSLERSRFNFAVVKRQH